MTLAEAIQQAKLVRVTQLIQQQIDVNQPCSNGQYPLTMAIELFLNGHSLALPIIQQILKAGASPQVLEAQPYLQQLCQLAPSSNWNLCFSSPEQKAEDVQALIELLITAGIDINRKDDEGHTPLYRAIYFHSEPAAMSLLKAGADFNEPGQSLLHMAVKRRMLQVAQELVVRGVDINATDAHQYTPLDLACSSKQTVLASWLIQQGAKTKRCDLIDLFLMNDGEIFSNLQRQLLDQGIAKYKRSKGETLLHIVTKQWLIKQLLVHDADVNAVTLDTGETPMHRLLLQPFSSDPEPELLPNLQQFFLAGARAQATNANGQTYLHVAIVNPYRAATIIEYLIEQGVPLNVRDAKGQTALHQCLIWQNHTAAQILLTHGADSTMLDKKGKTPLEHLTFNNLRNANDKEVVCTLIEQLLAIFPSDRLPANAKDLVEIAVVQNKPAILERLSGFDFATSGQTALRLALQSHNIELTVWLLQQGVPVNTQGSVSREAPLQIAASCLFAKGIEQLLACGAEITSEQNLLDKVLDGINFNYSSVFNYSSALVTEEAKQNAFAQVINILLPRLVQENNDPNSPCLLDNILDKHRINAWPLIRRVFELEARLPTGANGRLTDRLKRFIKMAVATRDKEVLATVLNSPSTHRLASSQLLSMAVDNNHISLLDYLLQQGCSIKQLIDAGYHNRLYLTEYALYPQQGGNLTTERIAFIKQLILRGAPVHFAAENRQNLLSTACASGWVEIVELLLTPEYGYQLGQLIPDPDHSTRLLTPLQLAVINQQPDVVALLLKLGANVHVKDDKQQTLLHLACDKGNLAIVKQLLTYGVELNAFASESGFKFTALEIAIVKSTPIDLLNALLDLQPLIRIQTLIYAILSKHPLAIIERLFSNQPLDMILSLKPLHSAVNAKRLDIATWLLQQPFADQLINSRDRIGRTPLYLIAKLGDKAFFTRLTQQGADSQLDDYEGISISQIALYYDTMDTLELKLPQPFNREAFTQLRAQLLEQPEISAIQEQDWRRLQLSHYCYKLIRLFNDATEAKAYITQFSDKTSSQPLHDLCLFNLPSSSQWDRQAWAQLALDNGPELTKYLHLAPAIEQKLKRVPHDLAEVKAEASQLRYNREAENPPLAKLFAQYQILERAFEWVLNHYQPKSQDFMPDLLVEGITIGKPRYQLVKLDKDDPLGFVLGAITHCCQSVGSQGEICAMHGMHSPYSGFYVVYKRPQNYLTLQNIINLLKNSSSFEIFLSQLQDKHQRRKYSKEITDLQTAGIVPEQIAPTLLQRLQAELQGEIVAQCWAWISTNNELIFDSWERIRPEDDVLCQPLLEHAAQQAIAAGFKRVLLGQGGQTPKLSLKAYEEFVQPKDYADYRDSSKLWQLADAASIQPETTLQTATITPNLVQFSAFLQSPVKEQAKRDFKQELIKICEGAKHVKLLNVVCNTSQADFTHLSKLNYPAVDDLRRQDKYIIQPILTEETHWSCLIVSFYPNRINQTAIELTYLDPLVKSMPDQLLNICHRLKRDSSSPYSKFLTMKYIEQPEDSGPWLLKTLANLVETGQLMIQPEVKIAAAEQAEFRFMPT